VWGVAVDDLDLDADVAGQHSILVRIFDPRGEKVLEKSYLTDKYGGFQGEFKIKEDSTLGSYRIKFPSKSGSISFRVEEYKKPEFEVTISAPEEVLKLGDKFQAGINAKYYFGAPVAKGKVKYKVLRYTHNTTWYPPARWDWLYGPGYWWFVPDYHWYPAFREWGCLSPIPHWFRAPTAPPELVMENEVEIGPDGTAKFEIDSALAKELHPDHDHRYEISAEVTDESRRTIYGQGQVIVARKPYRVFTWLDRGHYKSADNINASFSARTPDGKGVKGEGKVKLYRVSYNKNSEPDERLEQDWDLNTDEEGRAKLKIKAGKKGQYRLSYTLKDNSGNSIEGAYLFTVLGDKDKAKDFHFNDIELIADRREYSPGDKARFRINTAKKDSTVLLFLRPVPATANRPGKGKKSSRRN